MVDQRAGVRVRIWYFIDMNRRPSSTRNSDPHTPAVMVRQSSRWFREFIERHLDDAVHEDEAHGYDPDEFMTAHPVSEAPSRWDVLRQQAGEAVGALMPFLSMRNPDTPQARADYDAALKRGPGKLPPVPGSQVVDATTRRYGGA